jgi:hypothetical protein
MDMARKPVQKLDGSALSIWQILEAANAYYELSSAFTSTMPSGIDLCGPPTERLDLAMASATNRIFALELYLKACLIRSGTLMPMEHDLKNLFDSLPDKMQNSISENYAHRIKLEKLPYTPWDLTYCFRLGTEDLNADDVAREMPSVDFDPSLSSLLERNRAGFVSSRYLFSSAKLEKISCFTYEHRPLAILCRILCEALENSSATRPSLYIRHFKFEGEIENF